MNIRNSLLFLLMICIGHANAQLVLTIDASKRGADISPSMWGVFFEDINFAADGGLYAELVKNRSFEFYKPMMGWREIRKDGGNGNVLIINLGQERPQNPRIARININAENGIYGISNEGFRGIGLKQGKGYRFSMMAKRISGNVTVSVNLVTQSGKQIGNASIPLSETWVKQKATLTASETDPKAHLEIIFWGTGSIEVDMVSLFPVDTWKGRENGLRADLVQILADLKPGFIRFPGGCIVEGHELETRYQWKKTVGNPDDRTLIVNRWNTEFRHRPAPDYFQSNGLGFYEYFLLSEDVGAEPLPILNCGMACQFNSSEVAPLDQLDPYIQDALDLIEFANGPVSSKWGKLRADMGHPEPFNLKMLGIGNEQWDQQYIERYNIFAAALKNKYPSIQLVSSAGPSPDGPRFEYLWTELRKSNADLVDEHYYKEPAWFLKNASRYDNYDRKGPKIFAGEYAAHSKEDTISESRNSWISALSEAAFMTGLERNADIVRMASYAPLFAHVEAWQWRPDLIWFDNLRVVGTPNYYVQKMFSTNRGSYVVPALQDGKVLSGQDSIYASAVVEDKSLIVKIVNTSSHAINYELKVNGRETSGQGSVQVLSSSQPYIYNSLSQPDNVVPKDRILKRSKGRYKLTVEPMSFSVVSIPFR